MATAVLIPAHNPDERLVALVIELCQSQEFRAVIIVNDGSRPGCDPIFAELAQLPDVTVLRHAIKLGKGAALKTGMNYFCWALPECLGVITADADGQYRPRDIIRVARRLEAAPSSLVLGTRKAPGDVRWQNRFGNRFAQFAFWGLVGTQLSDTQTGLRGIPRGYATRLLRLKATGYEFELDMLIRCKYRQIPIVECLIETARIDAHRVTHFNPLTDSLRIYFVLLRFVMTSLITTVFGQLTFYSVYLASGSLLAGEACARVVGTGIGFFLVRKVVFRSRLRVKRTLPKFLFLVISTGTISFTLIQAIVHSLGWHVMLAKASADLLVYLANFAIQRDFVFRGKAIHENPSPALDADSVEPPLRRAA